MEKVAVSKGVLIGFGTVFAAPLLALVFFIGRESARKDVSPLSSSGETSVVPAPPSSVQLPEASVPEAPPSPTSPVPVTPPSPGPVMPAHGVSPAVAPADPTRAAVVAYFQAVDQIQPGQMSGDASDMANKILEPLAKGDTSGLDGMIQQAESTRKRLESLTPPQPCATFHRESLASLDDGLGMMRAVKKAMESSDVSGLSSLTDQGNAMRTRSEALVREEKAIRQRYGLPH